MSQLNSKPFPTISTYVIAALLGIGAAVIMKPSNRAADPGGSDKPTLMRRAQNDSTDEITLADAFISYAGVSSDQEQTDSNKDFRKLLGELEPASDPEATFRALLAEWLRNAPVDRNDTLSPEQLESLSLLSARFSQWLEVSPHEAIAALEQLDNRFSNHLKSHHLLPILGYLSEKQGIRSVMAWLPEIQPSYLAVMHLGIHLGKSGSVEELRWFLAEHAGFPDKAYAGGLQESLGDFWPTDRRDDLLGELSGDSKLRAMFSIANRMEGTKGMDWINAKLDQGEFTTEELTSALGEGEIRSFLSRLDAPLEDRVALMQKFGVAPAEITHAYKAQQLVHRDITNYLFNGNADQDWLYWFQSGEVSANEVYDAVLENIPDPGSEINEFKSQMFRHLAEQDPARALELLNGMSQNDQDWQKAYAARWWFSGVNPNEFYQMTSSISYANDPGMQQFIRECWNEKSRSNLERYGEGYFDWVRSLPDGQDRQWALEGLEQASRNKYSDIHREVSQLLDRSK